MDFKIILKKKNLCKIQRNFEIQRFFAPRFSTFLESKDFLEFQIFWKFRGKDFLLFLDLLLDAGGRAGDWAGGGWGFHMQASISRLLHCGLFIQASTWWRSHGDLRMQACQSRLPYRGLYTEASRWRRLSCMTPSPLFLHSGHGRSLLTGGRS